MYIKILCTFATNKIKHENKTIYLYAERIRKKG